METYPCLLCGDRGIFLTSHPVPLCESCFEMLHSCFLPRRFRSFCANCGFPLISGFLCGSCGESGKEHISLFLYRGIIKELISYYKFSGIREAGAVFSYFLNLFLLAYENPAVIPVPGNRGNVRKRGWDQVLMITKHLDSAKVPVLPLLEAKRGRVPQKLLSGNQRRQKRGNYFTFTPGNLNYPSYKSTEVFILDDVKTTGRTLDDASELISSAGFAHVITISIAMD